jgi:hypothetical protein
MCVDYTDINKTCKKDHFGQVMDSTVGCSVLSFLDCFSGYHQIPLKVEDQIKTSFITAFGSFCYTMMSFELKSAGATYQWGIQRCLHSQLGCNAEVYVDDVVVKTRENEGLISDLAETFNNLRKLKMKLEPEKCTFGVPSTWFSRHALVYSTSSPMSVWGTVSSLGGSPSQFKVFFLEV